MASNILSLDESDLKLLEPKVHDCVVELGDVHLIDNITYVIKKVPNGFTIRSPDCECIILFETLFNWVLPTKDDIIMSIQTGQDQIGDFTWSHCRSKYTNYYSMTPIILFLLSPLMIIIGLIGCLFATRWFNCPGMPLDLSLIACAWMCTVCDKSERSDRLINVHGD